MHRRQLWLRWVSANALGEALGLGLTFAVGYTVISGFQNLVGVGAVLLTFLTAVASGVIEATIVGLAQHWAMQPWFPNIRRRNWWLATLVGALLAYVLGYLPSTLIDLAAQSSPSPQAMGEPPQVIVLMLAAGLGIVGGAVLSFAQWWVLRGKVRRAAWWIPANMLAWLFGMPLIFWGIDLSQRGQPLWQVLLIMVGVLLLAGAVVGAIHGFFLVRMVND